MGRVMPPFVPNQKQRERIKSLSAVGLPQEQMARALGISIDTLRRHFRTEIEQGAVDANAAVGGALFRNATVHNNVIAQIFWMKARAGWKDRVDVHHQHSGSVTVTHEERLRQLAADPDERPMIEHEGSVVDVEDEPEPVPVPKGEDEAA